jgi:glycosyltransferase involved in cell wall biosynthesis
MRIGIVAPPWIPVPPPAYGGTEAVVDCLARGLAELGHEVILAAETTSTCPVTLMPYDADAEPPALGDLRQERRSASAAYAGFRDLGVDIVHDHTLAGPVHAAQLPALPVVTTMHGPFTPQTTQLISLVWTNVGIVAISRHQASTAGGVEVHRIIHHGLDASAIPQGSGDGGYLLFLGRMIPEKGVEQAIQIARSAGIPLRIAAKMREDVEREYFTSTIERLLSRDVEYLGEVSAAEKYQLAGDALALLNPIQWPEPFGMVMVEAMATGTPVIATSRGSAPELIEDGVTGFVRDTLGGLSAAAGQVGSLDRARIRAQVERDFSMQRMAREYAEFYELWLSSYGPDSAVRREHRATQDAGIVAQDGGHDGRPQVEQGEELLR